MHPVDAVIYKLQQKRISSGKWDRLNANLGANKIKITEQNYLQYDDHSSKKCFESPLHFASIWP